MSGAPTYRQPVRSAAASWGTKPYVCRCDANPGASIRAALQSIQLGWKQQTSALSYRTCARNTESSRRPGSRRNGLTIPHCFQCRQATRGHPSVLLPLRTLARALSTTHGHSSCKMLFTGLVKVTILGGRGTQPTLPAAPRPPIYGAPAPAVCSPDSPAGRRLSSHKAPPGDSGMPLRCSTAIFLATGEGHLILFYTNNSCVGLSSIRIILILKPSVNHKSVTHQGKQHQDTTNVSVTKAESVL